CHHPGWLLLSISQFFVTMLFVAFGVLSMKEVYLLAEPTHQFSDVMSGAQQHVLVKRRELWILLIVNTFAAFIQVASDAWLQHMYGLTGSCTSLETENQEIGRICLTLIAFDLPVWAGLLVFFWFPRHQLSSELDIP